MLEEYIHALWEELGLEDLPVKQADGFYKLAMEVGSLCWVKELSPGVFFRAQIGLCSGRSKEQLFRMFMIANLFGQETGGAVLALDETGEGIVLSLLTSGNIKYREFYEKLEDFLNYVDYWKNKVLEYEQAQAASPLR